MSLSHPHSLISLSPLISYSFSCSSFLSTFLILFCIASSQCPSLFLCSFVSSSLFFCPCSLTHLACHEQSKAEGQCCHMTRNKASWLEQLDCVVQCQRLCDREDVYLWWFVYFIMWLVAFLSSATSRWLFVVAICHYFGSDCENAIQDYEMKGNKNKNRMRGLGKSATEKWDTQEEEEDMTWGWWRK